MIGDRLWIQREIPKPSKNLKRKRPDGTAHKAKNSFSKSRGAFEQSKKRQRTQQDAGADGPSAPATETRRSAKDAQKEPARFRERAAKTRTNLKLEAQAKELAEFQKQMLVNGHRSS